VLLTFPISVTEEQTSGSSGIAVPLQVNVMPPDSGMTTLFQRSRAARDHEWAATMSGRQDPPRP
jgi:hypothetical protein